MKGYAIFFHSQDNKNLDYDILEKQLLKIKIMRWNLENIEFSKQKNRTVVMADYFCDISIDEKTICTVIADHIKYACLRWVTPVEFTIVPKVDGNSPVIVYTER